MTERSISQLHERFDHIQRLMTELEAAIDQTPFKTVPLSLSLNNNRQNLSFHKVNDYFTVALTADSLGYDSNCINITAEQAKELLAWLEMYV